MRLLALTLALLAAALVQAQERTPSKKITITVAR